MDRLLKVDPENISREYLYLNEFNRFLESVVEAGAELSGVLFSDEDSANSYAQNYIEQFRYELSRFMPVASTLVIDIKGNGIKRINPEFSAYSDESSSRFEARITIDSLDAMKPSGSPQPLDKVKGVIRDAFTLIIPENGDYRVIPHLVLLQPVNRGTTVLADSGVPVVDITVNPFALVMLDGNTQLDVARYERLARYYRAVNTLEENSDDYPWFTRTMSRMAMEIVDEETDSKVVGLHMRQLAQSLARTADQALFYDGVEVLGGFLSDANVTILSEHDTGMRITVGSIADVGGIAEVGEISLTIDTIGNSNTTNVRSIDANSIIGLKSID